LNLPPSKEQPGFSVVWALLLCDNVSYTKDYKPIDVYIKNIIPFGIRLPRRRSCAVRAGAMLNFANTEFYELGSKYGGAFAPWWC
jgi:hypothetical protein